MTNDLTSIQLFLSNQTENIGFFVATLIVAAALCYAIETSYPIHKNVRFLKKDFKKELYLAALNALVFAPIFTFLLSLTLLVMLNKILPYQIFDETLETWPFALQVICGLLVMDFSTYWRHRFTHNFMWPYHSFHHSAEEITWLTSLRLHPIDMFVAILFDTITLHIAGFGGAGILTANIIMTMYNYFTHLNLNFKFPRPLCYILASPHYHRWHHATDKAAYDKNFCGMFSLLDVLFGTYYNPRELPKAYGLSAREQDSVPEKLWAHIWLPIQNDLKKLQKKLGKN